MILRIARTLRELRSDTSGNALMLVAIGVPILIASAGMAVDFSQWYSWKRELQHATDQAALAAAWALSNSNTAMSGNYQTRGNQDYTNNLMLTKSFAKAIPTYKLANYSNGSNNSVVVTSSATRSLPFSSFVMGGRAVTINVTSQATFKGGVSFNACLISVGKDGTTFTVGGNANVVAHCGMAALSCSENAIVIDGSASVIADSIATCGTASVPAANESVVSENVTGLTDVFSTLSPPDNPTPRTYNCVGNGIKAQAAPLAGTYKGGLTVNCKTTLGSGIYVIDGGTLDLTGNYTVTGSNVMFVLKNGAILKLGGSGNGNTVSLTPMQASDFIALGYTTTQANNWANMLVFEDRNNNPSQDHIINGNSTSLFVGTIYMPVGTARVNGTASLDSSCLQISAWQIIIQGNAYLDTRCPTNQTNYAGTAAATVNLVA